MYNKFFIFSTLLTIISSVFTEPADPAPTPGRPGFDWITKPVAEAHYDYGAVLDIEWRVLEPNKPGTITILCVDGGSSTDPPTTSQFRYSVHVGSGINHLDGHFSFKLDSEYFYTFSYWRLAYYLESDPNYWGYSPPFHIRS